jgi:glycerol-3-phosphate dehydrogenase subunit B
VEALQFLDPRRLGFEGPGLGAPPLVLATEIGTWKTAAFASASAAAGARRPGVSLGLVELRGYTRFRAASPARLLETWARQGLLPVEVKVLSVDLPGSLGPDPSPAEVARSLDDEEALLRLGDAAHKAARQAGVRRLLFPPVLGLREARARRLSEIAGFSCAELLATSPSIPGVRLQRALDALLEGAGVEYRRGTVARYEAQAFSVRSVELADGSRVEADAFVLATGKFLAGGLRQDSRLRETLFDLPVHFRGSEVGEADVMRLTTPRPWEPQALFACGVRTDRELRPLKYQETVAFENLFAAGSVLAGYDPAWEGSGLGVAVATGYVAGRGAAGRG